MKTALRFTTLGVALVAIAVIFTACSGEQDNIVLSNDEVRESSKSLEHFKARQDEIALVNLDTLGQITESIVKSDPFISDEQFQERVFFELKKRGIPKEDNVAAGPYLYPYGYLTWAEFWLLLSNRENIIPTIEIRNDALMESQQQWQAMAGEDTKKDAFRHAYWNVLMAKRISLSWAQAFSAAHESETNNWDATRMDLHNNSIGRGEYNRNTSQSESWFSSHLRNFSYVYHQSGSTEPFGYTLVHIQR